MDKWTRGFKTARAVALASAATAVLAACDEGGGFALPTAGAAAQSDAPVPANAPNQRVSVERDVERPDVFEVTDRALWDGRPSLGGVWVAHPDVQDPERVLIRNTETGETIVGALFRRERQNPGPAIQISSDAAEELGVLAGAPVSLYVVALRRQEVEEVVPADNPVVASLDAPVNVESAPLDPAPVADDAVVADDAAVSALAAASTAVATDTASATVETTAAAASLAALATAAAAETSPDDAPEAAESETVDVSAVFAAPQAVADGPRAQIGIYSNERNANADAARIQQAGIAAEVVTETMGGQPVWRVLAGPFADDSALATLKGLGFIDAFILEDAE